MGLKKHLFSTKSYKLRKWLEETGFEYIKAKSTDSYYFRYLMGDKKFRIRISNHIPKKCNLEYDIIINNELTTDKLIYLVFYKENKSYPVPIESFQMLKFDIKNKLFMKLNSPAEIENDDEEENSKVYYIPEDDIKKKEKVVKKPVLSVNEYISNQNESIQKQIIDTSTGYDFKEEVLSTFSLKERRLLCQLDNEKPMLSNENAPVYSQIFSEMKDATRTKVFDIIDNHKKRVNKSNWPKVSVFIPNYMNVDKTTKKLIYRLFCQNIPYEKLCSFINEHIKGTKKQFFYDSYKILNCY